MSYTQINISDIENFVNDKLFDDIKLVAHNFGLRVRECVNESNLYLLVNENNKDDKNENNEDVDGHMNKSMCCQSNGIILEKNTNKIVCMSQNKFNKIESFDEVKSNSNKFRMEYCEDGTVIRLYNYNGKWLTATTKCIDASSSFWSSTKSFNDMFWELFNKDLVETLDPKFTYTFVLIHKENRIVVEHKYNNLIYINRINNESKLEDYTNYFYNTDPRRCIRRTMQIDMNQNVSDVLDDYYNEYKRGIILKFYNHESNNWDIYQYDFSYYSKLKNIRGNVPLIRMRYLELLNNEESLLILEDTYKESLFLFAMIKHQMAKLYKDIHKLYFESHVKHNITINEDHIYYKTMKQLHGQYKSTGNPITLGEVRVKVNTLDKHVLKKFLNWV
jgi:hypothetical protein